MPFSNAILNQLNIPNYTTKQTFCELFPLSLLFDSIYKQKVAIREHTLIATYYIPVISLLQGIRLPCGYSDLHVRKQLYREPMQTTCHLYRYQR